MNNQSHRLYILKVYYSENRALQRKNEIFDDFGSRNSVIRECVLTKKLYLMLYRSTGPMVPQRCAPFKNLIGNIKAKPATG